MSSVWLTKARLKAGTSPDKVLAKAGWKKQTHLKIIQKDYNSELLGKLTMAAGGRRNQVKPDTKVPVPTPLHYPIITKKDYEGLKSGFKDMIKMRTSTAKEIGRLDSQIKKLVGPRDAKEADLKKTGTEIDRLDALLDRMEQTCQENAEKCRIQAPASAKSHKAIMRLYDHLEKTRKDIEKFDKSEKANLLAAYKSLKKDLQTDIRDYESTAKDISKFLVELSYLMP